ncbi:MAG: tetratricopeptide repeat protein [Acidobacteriota bacterium]|nr:tetratricopeptide repeat protein [Acidobacteriota bacterium]
MSEVVTKLTDNIPPALIPCPNPRCENSVNVDATTCPKCQHELGACPRCGRLMSSTIGFCGSCGYGVVAEEAATEPAPNLQPPHIIRFAVSREALVEVFAKAYFQAANSDADMSEATRALEQIRMTFIGEPDAFKIWALLDEQVALAEERTIRPALCDVRHWFESQLVAQQQNRLRDLLERNPSQGWREWIRTFSESLAQWQLFLCRGLTEANLPFPAELHSPHDFPRMVQLIIDERWPQVHQFFSYLAEHSFLHPLTRARLLVPAGQIQLYHFGASERALEIFQTADKLAPKQGRVLAAFGEYHLQMNTLDEAQTYLKQAIAATPDEVEGYVFMGDLSEKQVRLEEARTWHEEAIRKVPGDALGYTRLLRLFGRPEFIEKFETQIMPLASRAIAIDELGKYRTCLDVGDAYIAGKRFDVAQSHYQTAINLDPKRLDGYTWSGFAYLEEVATKYDAPLKAFLKTVGVAPDTYNLEEVATKYDAARKAFLKAVEVAPDAYNGYWGMGQLCERQKQWREAAEWYAKVGERQPEFKSGMLARVGDMHLQLQEYERAEAVFIEVFKLDGSSEDALLTLADDYYRKHNRIEDARRLYKEIRELKGELFEAAYRNRLGNICYFEAKYDEAAKYFAAAIEADSQTAIYYSNLADANRVLKKWDEARSLLSKAFSLNEDKQDYDTKLALVYNDEGNEFYAQGQYEKAIECYSEAEKLAPTLPRYPSNRALALEQLILTSTTPLDLLERAIDDARKAVEQAESLENASALLKDFSEQLAELQRRRTFASHYGANAQTLDPREKTTRLYLKLDALSTVINPEQTALSEDFMRLIDELHSHVTEKSGLRLPSIMVYRLDPPVADWADYAFEVMSERILEGNLELEKQFALCSGERLAEIHLATDEPGFPENVLEGYWLTNAEAAEAAEHKIDLLTPQEYLLRCVEAGLSGHLDKACGHQEVANMLAQYQTADSNQIMQDPEKLHELTLALKERLRRGDPLRDLQEFCANFNGNFLSHPSQKFQPKSAPGSDGQTIYKSLQVGFSPQSSIDRSMLNDGIAKIQNEIFNRLGVIFPQPSIVDRDDLEANELEIQADGKELLRAFGPGPDEIAVTASVKELQKQYPTARPLFHPFSNLPASAVRLSEGLETELNINGYSTVDALGYVLGLVLMEVNNKPAFFLTTELLDHYLAMLQTDFGALVAVAQHYFSDEALMELLRGRLRAGSSIKNMPELLELFLSDPTTESAGVH